MTSQYLALYIGPNGPISAIFDAESDRRVALLARIDRDRGEWYDNAENKLGLAPDAPYEEIRDALAAQGWEPHAAARVGAWGVYRVRPLLERMRESSAFRLAAEHAAEGYVVAAEWTELGTDGDFSDGAALADHWVASETEVVAAFVAQNWTDFELYCEQRATHPSDGSAAEHFGHDLWLTRNGHGVGFWDREELAQDLRERLTAAAQALGEAAVECEECEESAE